MLLGGQNRFDVTPRCVPFRRAFEQDSSVNLSDFLGKDFAVIDPFHASPQNLQTFHKPIDGPGFEFILRQRLDTSFEQKAGDVIDFTHAESLARQGSVWLALSV